MRVFLDFEACSLAKDSYPIEVAWVWEDGQSESHLIQPQPGWTDLAEHAEAIHHVSQEMLTGGTSHNVVAHRMVEVLTGHDLFASAPSWDGKWVGILLRAAGLPRHALRLRDSDDLFRETASGILGMSFRMASSTRSYPTYSPQLKSGDPVSHQSIEHCRMPRRRESAGSRSGRRQKALVRQYGGA